MKATLSHDRYEIEHPYVHEVQSLGFTVKNIITRGWPSCIFASARNESKWSVWPEIQSRFLIVSPNIIPEKIQEGNILIGQKMSLPDRIKNKIIVSPEEKILAAKCAKYLTQQIKAYMTQEPDKQRQPFWIPYGVILSAALSYEKGTDNRITTRLFSFLHMITISRAHLRCRLQFWNEILIISSIADLHETLLVMQNLSGIPNYKLSMYNDHFLPCYQEKDLRLEGRPDVSEDGKKHEEVLGLTTREFCDYYSKKMNKNLSTKTLRETYFEEWYNNGLIEEVDSVINGKQKIYYPITPSPSAPPSPSDSQEFIKDAEPDKDKDNYDMHSWISSGIKPLGVSAQSPIVLQPRPIIVRRNFSRIPKNWLEMQIWALLRWAFQEGKGVDSGIDTDILSSVRFYDENGSEICACQFVDRYNTSYPSYSLNAYFQNGVFCTKSERNTVSLKYLDDHTPEECKLMGDWVKTPNSLMLD